MTEPDKQAPLQFGIGALLMAALVVSLTMSSWITLRGPGRVIAMFVVTLFVGHLVARALGRHRPWFLLHLLVVAVSLALTMAVAIICSILLVKLQWAHLPPPSRRPLDFSRFAYWLEMPIWGLWMWCESLLFYACFGFVTQRSLRPPAFVVGACLTLAGGIVAALHFKPDPFGAYFQGAGGAVAGGLYCLLVSQFAFWSLYRGDRGATRLTDGVAARWRRWRCSVEASPLERGLTVGREP